MANEILNGIRFILLLVFIQTDVLTSDCLLGGWHLVVHVNLNKIRMCTTLLILVSNSVLTFTNQPFLQFIYYKTKKEEKKKNVGIFFCGY